MGSSSILKILVFLLSLQPNSSFHPSSPRPTTTNTCSMVDRAVLGRRRQTSLRSSRRNNLSASERERREEERRRRERTGEVVIGKTSARREATDYALDVASTEQQWMNQASELEQEVFRETERGMEMLKMLRLEEATSAFDHVFDLKPNAYLWQAGIARYYLDDLEGAAEIFARNAGIFESKFGEPASEERIWRHACELKLFNSMPRGDRRLVEETGGIDSLLTPVPERENTEELLRSETRRVIKVSRDLFSATVEGDITNTILSRARLRSIAGVFDSKPKPDIKMWKLSSWFYLGLHHDSLGDYDESKKCMKMALRLCPSSGNANDIIHTLPMLHMSQRDWFDDDGDFDADLFESIGERGGFPDGGGALLSDDDDDDPFKPASAFQNNRVEADPVAAASIKKSLAKLRHADLQNALRLRGVRAIGSKAVLQRRLFYSLMEDVGLIV